jgi:hypothetical protein
MAILFDRDFGRVWSDGTTPCVFSSIERVPHKAEMEELVEKQLQLVRELKFKFGKVYSILDLRVCPQMPDLVIEHYLTNVLPRQFKAGVKHKAIVEPGEKISREIFVLALNGCTHMPISVHTSFEKALDTITKLRLQEKSSVYKNTSTTLLQTWYNRLF